MVNTGDDHDSELRLQSSRMWSEDIVQYPTMEGLEDMQDNVQFLHRLVNQEKKHYQPCLDYLLETPASSRPKDIERVSEVWRQKVCEWSYQVIDHYNFNREVVYIALNYLDRMVAKVTQESNETIRKTNFRLIAVTSLYMAVKLHGTHMSNDGIRRKLRISTFYELSERCFSVADIEAMERKILSSLDWHVNPSTPLSYIDSLVSLCPRWQSNQSNTTSSDGLISNLKDLALYLSELSVSYSRFTFTSSSLVVSYASILCAIESLEGNVMIPLGVQSIFLKNMAGAIELVPTNPEVIAVVKLFKDLCPDIFPQDGISHQEQSALGEDGKTSPVCIMDEQIGGGSPNHRKRSRSNAGEGF